MSNETWQKTLEKQARDLIDLTYKKSRHARMNGRTHINEPVCSILSESNAYEYFVTCTGDDPSWVNLNRRLPDNSRGRLLPVKFQIAVPQSHFYQAAGAVQYLFRYFDMSSMKFALNSGINARIHNNIVVYVREGDFAGQRAGDFVDMLEYVLRDIPSVDKKQTGISQPVGYQRERQAGCKVFIRSDGMPSNLSCEKMQTILQADPGCSELAKKGYMSRKATMAYARRYNVPEHNPFGFNEYGLGMHRISHANGKNVLKEMQIRHTLSPSMRNLPCHGIIEIPSGIESLGRPVGGEYGAIFEIDSSTYFVRFYDQSHEYGYSACLHRRDDGSYEVDLAYTSPTSRRFYLPEDIIQNGTSESRAR